MSIRSEPKTAATDGLAEQLGALAADGALGEGNSFSTADADAPMVRNVVVTLRASLNDLCLSSQKAVWAPSSEALRSIFQARKFTGLDGSSEAQGDLRSVVLHKLTLNHVKSSFPLALGAKITGVDDITYSSTGEAFSAVVLPQAECTTQRQLQADDVSLAYEFSKKFPGYTAQNLETKGIHEVAQRRFVLVAADHPLISAVKISSELYESVLPAVRAQVDSQIKVRDLSKYSVAVQPADYASWSDARAELMVEAKRPLKAQLQAELAAATDEKAIAEITEQANQNERAIEMDIDHRMLNLSMDLTASYNFLS